MVVLLVIIVTASIHYEFILVVGIITSIVWLVCLSLIAHFYVKAYLAVRHRTILVVCDEFFQFLGFSFAQSFDHELNS